MMDLMAYLRQYRKRIIVYGLFSIIFLSIFQLYHLPMEAVIYPVLICAFIGMFFLMRDYTKWRRKHRRLQEISRLPDSLMEEFPEVKTMEDADYQQIIRLLQEEQQQLSNAMNARYADMIDYYTMWVHQIKTPIASMRLNLQNEDTEFSRQLSEDLFRIEQYVEMVLCYLRLDAGSTDYVIQEYDLDAIVRQAVKKFAGQFFRRKLHLQYEPLNKSVLTDEKWLLFIIEQIISNALKYTPPGGTITIEMEEPATLCIRDTGIGIAAEDLPRIFEKGYTGYNGRSDKKASGIGLYICRRICNNLGHRILASSSPDSGTVIRIGLEHRELEVE